MGGERDSGGLKKKKGKESDTPLFLLYLSTSLHEGIYEKGVLEQRKKKQSWSADSSYSSLLCSTTELRREAIRSMQEEMRVGK